MRKKPSRPQTKHGQGDGKRRENCKGDIQDSYKTTEQTAKAAQKTTKVSAKAAQKATAKATAHPVPLSVRRWKPTRR